MAIKWKIVNREVHLWASLAIVLPLSVVIVTGILLLLKKDVDWIQPPSKKSEPYALTISFDEILKHAATVPEANLTRWKDIDRLDVRPKKGIVKVRGKNRWEIQLSTQDGRVLQVMRRNSDLIESLHDGSWFHDMAKYWVFLPAAVILLIMLITGMYLFIITIVGRSRVKKRRRMRKQATHFAE